jgi:hypothetical protein
MTEVKENNNISFQITGIDFVSTWTYDCENDICHLCRKSLTDGIIYYKKTDNNVLIGNCKHGYHESCMNTWLSDGNLSCPYCKTMWDIHDKVSSGVFSKY